MSAGGGKAVERFNCTNGGAQFCQGCYTMTPDSEGEYVRHDDYAKLEQQRAALVDRVTALVEALKAMLEEDDGGMAAAQAKSALKAAGEGL